MQGTHLICFRNRTPGFFLLTTSLSHQDAVDCFRNRSSPNFDDSFVPTTNTTVQRAYDIDPEHFAGDTCMCAAPARRWRK